MLQAPLSFSWHEALHVLLGLAVRRIIIDQHLPDIVGQVVAHGAGDGITFAIHEEGRRALLFRDRNLVPLRAQVIQIPLQLLDAAPDARGADDGAHAFRDLQLAHDLAHLIAVLAFDTA